MIATSTALAIGAATAGVGASIYGANKQSKAIKSANATNAKNIADTNAANKESFYASRGIGANGQAVNARLPMWMTAQVGSPGASAGRRLVRRTAQPAAAQRILGSGSTPVNF